MVFWENGIFRINGCLRDDFARGRRYDRLGFSPIGCLQFPSTYRAHDVENVCTAPVSGAVF